MLIADAKRIQHPAIVFDIERGYRSFVLDWIEHVFIDKIIVLIKQYVLDDVVLEPFHFMSSCNLYHSIRFVDF